MTITIVHAEALEWLRGEPACSFDAFFADAPYGLSPDGRARTWDDIEALRASGKGGRRRGFMNKKWDAGVPGPSFWAEVLRVLKPGAPILVFGGTRTYHRLTCALEDAGAEVVDCIAWLYAQGMPKSVDLSKAIDKAAGATRKVVGTWKPTGTARPNRGKRGHSACRTSAADPAYDPDDAATLPITEAATDLAVRWVGYGTALRPAFEPCVLACKPFDGTIANNAQRWGVGGLWIDATRLPRDYAERSDAWKRSGHSAKPRAAKIAAPPGIGITLHAAGGWPANACLDEVTAAALDQQTGPLSSGGSAASKVGGKYERSSALYGGGLTKDGSSFFGDTGGASRFFYVAKTSRWEREFGCEALPMRTAEEVSGREAEAAGTKQGRAGAAAAGGVRNHHPCLKPIRLTEQLAKLILPPTRETPRRVLNAFAGSGSEAIGAMRAGWDEVIAIEREAEYVPALEARVKRWAELPAEMSIDDVQETAIAADPSQLSLLEALG